MKRPIRSIALSFARLGAAALVLAFACEAAATPNFPSAIQTKLSATARPECSICHVGGRVGRGTVNTAFGSEMRRRGLVAYDEDSLGRALDGMAAERVDSDGDGTLDVDALRAGKDPNPAGADEGILDETTPQYGCVGRIAPGHEATEHGALLILFVLAALTTLR